MKALLQRYASFNLWAHQKMLERISRLTDEQIHQEITSSFPGIFKTVLHLWDAESIWWQRLKLSEHIEVPSLNFSGNFGEAEKNLLQQSRQWEEWVNNANENQLQHVFAYQNSKKELFKQPVNEVLLHLFNHGTYHRGQLVTMLRQVGANDIPHTDFIVFSRNNKM